VNALVTPWEPTFVLGGEKLASSKSGNAKKPAQVTKAKSRKRKS
jgi:hypothetical protein